MAVLVPHLQQGFLARYLEQQRVTENQLRELLFDASEDADRRIRDLAGREGVGARVRMAQLGVARVELAGIIDETYRGPVERAIREGIGRAAQEGGTSFFRVLDALEGGLGKGIPGLREGIITQARRGAENLVSRGMNDIPLSRQVYRTGALAKDQLYRTINSMVATGSSWAELAKEAKRFISPFTPGGAGYAAKRLARTELNNAFHTTQIRTTLKNPFVEGYRWRLSGSHPRPDQCNIYADWNGTGVFTKASVPGKPHPNCLCFLMYETPSVEEFQTKFLNGDYDKWLEEFVVENAPHLKGKLAATAKARPKTPAKTTQKRAAPRQPARPAEETPLQALNRIKNRTDLEEFDLDIMRSLSRGASIRDVVSIHWNRLGKTWKYRETALADIEARIRRLDFPYERSVRWDPKYQLDPKAMTADRRKEVLESMDDFNKRYPERSAELKNVRTTTGDPLGSLPKDELANTFAYYRGGGVRQIYLNPRYYKHNDVMTRSVTGSARSRFHPPNCSHNGSIFDHEFGHHLDDALPRAAREELLVEVHNALLRDRGVYSPGEGLTRDEMLEQYKRFRDNARGEDRDLLPVEWFFLYKMERIAGDISTYAKKNAKEFIAELVSEFRAPRQSRYSKIAQRIFDREFGPEAVRKRVHG